MLDDLASTIAAAAKLVSGGILLFFPSYKLLNDCYERWHKKGGLDEIEAVKKVFREPHNAGDYQAVIDRFYSEIYEGEKKGAVMMGVCRGRISEGLDFSDEAARMVVVIGIPFPQMYDAKVILKRNYLDAKGCQLSGRDWYNQQATRAVNQAIGRVIRHA
jgi:Rad3-related DNA helicase